MAPKKKMQLEDLAEIVRNSNLRFEKSLAAMDARVENLAVLMANRFDNLENRFDVLEHRFDVLENRFDVLEHRFDDLEHRVDSLAEGLNFVRADVRDMKLVILPADKRLDDQQEEIAELSARVNKLEDKVFVT